MVRLMKKMASNHQVISISHLAQFAAGGDQHFFVYKDHLGAKSTSHLRKLEGDDRVAEIAKMIGGDHPTSMAFESARELLSMPTV